MKSPATTAAKRAGRRAAPAVRSDGRAGPAGKTAVTNARTGLPVIAPMLSLARQIRDWAESMVIVAGPAADLALQVAGNRIGDAWCVLV
jgi:hypothetical protein